jgi:hypothetical protein
VSEADDPNRGDYEPDFFEGPRARLREFIAEKLHTDLVVVSARPNMDYARMMAECIIANLEDEPHLVAPILGKADWIYDRDFLGDDSGLEMYIPCCSRGVYREIPGRTVGQALYPCGNGPLVGDQIKSGDCGQH